MHVSFSAKSRGREETNSRKGYLNKVFLFDSETVSQQQTSCSKSHLKLLELLLGSSRLCHFEDVEPHGLAEWSALSDGHDVSNCDVSAETHKTGVNRRLTRPR